MIFFNTKANRYFVLGQEFLKYSHIRGLKTYNVLFWKQFTLVISIPEVT